MSFQDLTDVHTRRYAQRVQYDIYRRTVSIVRHIFDRVDLRDNTLVTVTTRHLITRLDTAFNGQVYLNNLQHARCQIVALGDFTAFRFEFFLELVFQFVILLSQLLQLILFLFVGQAQFQPAIARQFVELVSFNATGNQHSVDTAEQTSFEDLQFFRQVFFSLLQLHLFDLKSTLVFFYAVTGKHLNVDNGTRDTVRYAQRRVFNVRRFLTEDRAQQFLFRSQLGFTFRGYLTNQNVAAGHFRTDINDTGFIQFRERGFTHVRDVSGDLFRPQLGVTGHACQFLNVDGGETVFLDNTLGYEDGVFEVVAVPRHERYAHVLTQRQFTEVGGRAVGQDVAAFNWFTQGHARHLVDAGVLVRTGVLGQVIDVDTCFARVHLVFVNFDNDTGSIHVLNGTATFSHRSNTGVNGNSTFHTGTNQRLISAQSRNRLTLHVRTHQCTVGVIVFQERDQGRTDGYHLLGGYVHVVNLVAAEQAGFAFTTAGNQIFNKVAFVIQVGVRLSDDVVTFFDSRQVMNFVGNNTVGHFTIRGLEETVFVSLCVHGQGVDQTDVRTFRRFDWTYATIVSRVYVSNFEACAFTGQTAWAECGDTTFVRNLRQRVVLVHKLGQLAGTKELFHCCGNRLGVDHILRHQGIQIAQRQTLFNRTLYTHQANAELVFRHFANGTDTTVAEVVDIIDFAFTVTDIDELLHHFDDVVFAQDTGTFDFVAQQRTVELHTTNRGQIVTVFGEEQVLKQAFSRFTSRRLTRAHHAVDFYQRAQTIVGWVDAYSFRNVRTVVQIVGEQRFDTLVAGLAQFSQQIQAQLHVRRADQFTGRFVDVVFRSNFTRDVLNRNFDMFDIVFFQLANMARGNTTAFLNVHFTVGFDIEGGGFTAQTLRYQLHLQLVVANFKDHFLEEQVKDLLSGVIQRAQNDGCRQFTTTVDTNEQVVFRVEFEVQPGTTVRNDTCVIQDLTGRVSLTFVTVKEDARATVQLRNDNTLGTVDNEGTVVGHERDFAHVDFLFFNVFNGAFRRFALVDHQTQFHAQRCGIRHATDLTFFNIKNRFAQTVADVLQL